jgi:AraC-like DNA-binding protein
MRDRPKLDPLAQTIALLRPRALLWKQLEASGDWAIRFPANDGVVFSLVTEGTCIFQVADRAPRILYPGDFLLLASPPDWTLGATATAVPVDYQTPDPDRPAVLAAPGEGGPARVLGGRFGFDAANAALLDGLLPPLVEIGPADSGAPRLRGLLDLIGDEALSDRPGRSLVLDRLLEILLVEAIRQGATDLVDRQGLLAGLSDPQMGAALRALHAEPQRSWTVADLAALAGMSRSVFAERFARRVGLAPIDYLMRWRMTLAKDALRSGDGRLAEVAAACGYQSVSAFSAAFSRTVGCSPSQYARGQGAEAA